MIFNVCSHNLTFQSLFFDTQNWHSEGRASWYILIIKANKTVKTWPLTPLLPTNYSPHNGEFKTQVYQKASSANVPGLLFTTFSFNPKQSDPNTTTLFQCQRSMQKYFERKCKLSEHKFGNIHSINLKCFWPCIVVNMWK